MWGRPLRSIFSIFNGKKLPFKIQHLESHDHVIIEQNLVKKFKKIKNFEEYCSFLKINKIILDQRAAKRTSFRRSC